MGKKLASSPTAWEIKKPRKPEPTPPSSPKDRPRSIPTKRMSSAYDAATPLPRKSGKAKKGYSINNVMCSNTRKK
jgi:hypothetical protein